MLSALLPAWENFILFDVEQYSSCILLVERVVFSKEDKWEGNWLKKLFKKNDNIWNATKLITKMITILITLIQDNISIQKCSWNTYNTGKNNFYQLWAFSFCYSFLSFLFSFFFFLSFFICVVIFVEKFFSQFLCYNYCYNFTVFFLISFFLINVLWHMFFL